jgi:hypothetical protein
MSSVAAACGGPDVTELQFSEGHRDTDGMWALASSSTLSCSVPVLDAVPGAMFACSLTCMLVLHPAGSSQR